MRTFRAKLAVIAVAGLMMVLVCACNSQVPRDADILSVAMESVRTVSIQVDRTTVRYGRATPNAAFVARVLRPDGTILQECEIGPSTLAAAVAKLGD